MTQDEFNQKIVEIIDGILDIQDQAYTPRIRSNLAELKEKLEVYKAFHAIKEEVDRQIAERRSCPFNPMNKGKMDEWIKSA
jgi:hypothetical protein